MDAIGGSARQVVGHVKWFDRARGFGFLVSDEGGPDILLHQNVLRAYGQTSVSEGAMVVARVQATERGVQAMEVLDLAPPAADTAEAVDAAPEVDFDTPLMPARVKWFDRSKGFGFANVFGAPEDVFLHVDVLRRAGLGDLIQGEAIAVRVVDGRRGKHAVDIRPWE